MRLRKTLEVRRAVSVLFSCVSLEKLSNTSGSRFVRL